MVPKKPVPKTKKDIIEKPITKVKKMKKKSFKSFAIYLFKLLRSVSKDFGISKQSMLIMNNFVNDMLERIAVEAGRLVAHGKRTTLGSQEIQSAIKLLIPGELAKHANIEGMKAIALYKKSQERQEV